VPVCSSLEKHSIIVEMQTKSIKVVRHSGENVYHSSDPKVNNPDGENHSVSYLVSAGYSHSIKNRYENLACNHCDHQQG